MRDGEEERDVRREAKSVIPVNAMEWSTPAASILYCIGSRLFMCIGVLQLGGP